MKLLYITSIDEWMYPNITKILKQFLKDDFLICDLRKEKEKFLSYLNKADVSLIDHVTLNQSSFIKLYKYYLESPTIKVFIDDSDHPFLFDIIKNENLNIYFKKELIKIEYMLKFQHFTRGLFSRYENFHFHFKWLSIEETIKVRKELGDKIIPLPHTFFPLIKIKEREKIYSVSLISRVSPPSIIRVLGNYDSFSSRTGIAKIVSKIPKSFVHLSYSGAKNIYRLPNIPILTSYPFKTSSYLLPFNYYLQILAGSKASIAPISTGYDTYRYWEIPLCGAALIAQNQYTIIPNNFEHKKSALFFSSLKELKDILEYYFLEGNEEELLKIAENGRRHLLQYHTPQHRANYVIESIKRRI
ncbi:MAG: glycosyltransferase [Thermoproteota archaeon]|nr:glycosyltransferase [Thermoproteota archaeon]